MKKLIALIGLLLLPLVSFGAAYPVSQGGTATTTFNSGGVLYSPGGTKPLRAVATSTNSLLFSNGSGVLSWIATSSLGITQDLSNYLTLSAWYATTTDTLDEGSTNLYFTNARAVSALAGLYEVPLTFDDGLTRTSNEVDFNCSEVEGTGINCSTNDITLDATGDWTGTLDGIEGASLVQTSRTLTVAGTANQITTSAGAQDLSANRTWTLSLPNHVIFPSSFFATNASTTNATTTALAVTGLTSALVQTDASGNTAEYAGTSCTNQFVRALSALGIATCATVQNTDLANSAVSYGGVSVSLGGSDATPAFNLADATGLPISTGVSGLASGIATFLGTPSSANLDSAVTDDTGSGALVFATSPTLVTPALGTPSSGTLTNATGLPLTTGITGTLPIANGGTNLSSVGASSTLLASNGTGYVAIATSSLGLGTVGTGATRTVAYYPTTANTLAPIPNSAITIDALGTSVGIFDTSPSSNFDVTGTAHFSSTLLAENTITSANGGFRSADGTVSSPVYAGTSANVNTGLYFPATDTLGFAIDGADLYRMDSTGLFAPTIYGTSTSGGDLAIQSTSHATKGLITIGDGEDAGQVGVGGTNAAGTGLYFYKNWSNNDAAATAIQFYPIFETTTTGRNAVAIGAQVRPAAALASITGFSTLVQFGAAATQNTTAWNVTTLNGNSIRVDELSGYNATVGTLNVQNIAAGVKGGTGTFTTMNVLNIPAGHGTFGASNVRGIHSAIAASSTAPAANYNLYIDGTAPNYLAGNLGIGTSSPSRPLSVQSGSDTNIVGLKDSDGQCLLNPESASLTTTCSSDARLKKDIKEYGNALEYLKGFNVRQYKVKASGDTQVGVIAQELQKTHPELVSKEKTTGDLMVSLPSVWYLVAAVQEQQQQITDLQERMKALDGKDPAPVESKIPWVEVGTGLLAGLGGVYVGSKRRK